MCSGIPSLFIIFFLNLLFSRGALMDDAMILPCGHSFGSGGMQQVYRMVRTPYLLLYCF